jgi:DNA-binding NarL/FixJ family response regulator
MSERTDQLLDELVRLTALSLRRGMDSQTEAILAFLQAGLEPSRIAELLGTTPATVRATKQKAANKPARKDASTKAA